MTEATASSERVSDPLADAQGQAQARALAPWRHEHCVVHVPAPPGTSV